MVVDAGGTVRISTAAAARRGTRRALPDFKQNAPNAASSVPPIPPVTRRRNSSEKPIAPPRPGLVAVLPYGFASDKKAAWDLFCLSPRSYSVLFFSGFKCFFHSEVARQISLYQQKLFCQIAPHELIGQRWSKADKLVESPNVCWLIEQFNVLSGVVSTT